MSIVETERIVPPPEGDGSDETKTIQNDDTESQPSIYDLDEDEETADYLATPKKTNIRRLSGELKETASGALVFGVDGIKKAASGLSSGLRTVTNKIPMPKSPKALRRRSWNAYDELEDHIVDVDPGDNGEKNSEKDDTKKDKVNTSKDKIKKDKTKTKKNGGKKGAKSTGKIDWLMIDHDGNKCDDEEKIEKTEFVPKSGTENENEAAPSKVNGMDEESPVSFDSLASVEVMSKLTINVEHMD